MICGHDRETLQWALCHEQRCGGLGGFDAVVRGDDSAAAWRAIHNPTKLAAIIAELMRERGRTVRFYDQHEHGELGSQCGDMVWIDKRYDPTMLHIHIETDSPPFELGRGIEIPQARAFALRLLDATTTTAQDVERMIGEL